MGLQKKQIESLENLVPVLDIYKKELHLKDESVNPSSLKNVSKSLDAMDYNSKLNN